ncbi:Starch-binding associating with outer membrane [Arenibacter nanhaiticus]|uniref:Starch-binding associating with outer membrane n=2 Tax=Arenibacter nanhaiticus TaxID=558155 RepID=A0A1M6MJZ3_9FLAO|nr:Starch-binding associating with outer membrane [Arenibacter nanhaiticus]
MFLMIYSCQDDILDKSPLGSISDTVVWSDPVLIDSYLIDLYAQTPVFVNDATSTGGPHSTNLVGMFTVNEMSDEATFGWGFYTRFEVANAKGGLLDINGGMLEYWELPYKVIRALNVFIEKIADAPVPENFKKVRTAEAKFLRAFNYFAMVKRYGGVPLITKAQNIDDSREELYPARNSEKEVYDFIISEMTSAAKDLPSVVPTEDLGRPSKFAALALKSRVALYAGSIAQYGDVQLDGLLGFPIGESVNYYQTSYDASLEIISEGHHALYNQDTDKTNNFKNIFLNEGNRETIFSKRYDGVSNGGIVWGYDFAQAPNPHAWGAGNKDAPFLEMVYEFERLDGSPGVISSEELGNSLWTIEELWGGRDPRLLATIYTQDTPWQGEKVDFHNGIILEDGTIQHEGSYSGEDGSGEVILAKGRDFQPSGTGFGVMKYLDPNADNLQGIANSKTDYIVFRYAEILLNLAESAFELGKTDEALEAINKIRERAGMPVRTSIDFDDIVHERKVELAFEGHRYWDLRRWRRAEEKLTGGNSGIRYVYDYGQDKYAVWLFDKNVETVYGNGNRVPLFKPHYYYFPITLSRTGQNPNLLENPGY